MSSKVRSMLHMSLARGSGDIRSGSRAALNWHTLRCFSFSRGVSLVISSSKLRT